MLGKTSNKLVMIPYKLYTPVQQPKQAIAAKEATETAITKVRAAKPAKKKLTKGGRKKQTRKRFY
jgi:hypothetical protein